MASSKTNTVAITGECLLPSNGQLGAHIPKEVVLRAMTTMEEKQRLFDSGLSRIPKLIQACMQSPKNVDIMSMPMFDIVYLMYRERMITFGNMYDVSIECDFCDRVFENTVDLAKLEVNIVPEGFKPQIDLPPLPVSGDQIKIKIITIGEQLEIETEAKRMKLKIPDYKGDPDFILSKAYAIVSVNGKEMIPPEKVMYVEKMHAADFNAFDQWTNETVNSYGMDNKVMMECPHCQESELYSLPLNSNFFRPKVPPITKR